MMLAVGSTVGPYAITGPLGKGGMGEVWRARDGRLGRDVAIKAMSAEFAGDLDRLARFEREAKVLASLNHPNIAALYGIEQTAGQQFLVLELVEGETLADRVARGPLPLPEALTIAIQIAEGIEAAHEKDIVHRDLKPANIKLTPDGRVKVLDFGLAKALGSGATDPPNLSPTIAVEDPTGRAIIGTAAYMAPEQARGVAVDKRADVWSFGVVLYELLSGRRAFERDTVPETLVAFLKNGAGRDVLPEDTAPALRRL